MDGVGPLAMWAAGAVLLLLATRGILRLRTGTPDGRGGGRNDLLTALGGLLLVLPGWVGNMPDGLALLAAAGAAAAFLGVTRRRA